MREILVRVVDVYAYRMVADKPLFLLCMRAPDTLYAGQWRMIGGKVEPDETAWQAALRELEEESRLKPVSAWSLPSVNMFYEWQHDRVTLGPAFAVEVEGAPILNKEHVDYGWFSREDALPLLIWPEQKRLLALADDLICAHAINPTWILPLYPVQTFGNLQSET